MREWIKNFLDKYGCKKGHPKRVEKYSLKFFELTKGILHDFSEKEIEYLETGACLHDVGYSVSSKEHHKHSYDVIMGENLDGMNSEQKKIVANIARYHRGSMPKENHKNFILLEERQKELVKKLGGIVKLADGFDGCPFAPECEMDIAFDDRNRVVCFRIFTSEDYSYEALKPVLRKKDLFEEGFDVQVLFVFSSGC